MPKPYLCIAHRGGQAGPQNSIEAIEHSLQIGVDAIEIDIWHIEGELLVTHDRRLGHALPGAGLILQQSLSALTSLQLSNGEPVPLLIDILNKVSNRTLLNIEIKNPGCVDPLVTQLERYREMSGNTFENIVVSSFNHHEIHALKLREKSLKRGVLIEGIPYDYAQCCEALEAYSFHTHVGFTSQDLVNDAHKRGFVHWVYTGNFSDEWQLMYDLGVDGVFTDNTESFMDFRANLN